MNFTSIMYFIEAARARSLTEAAERLHITQQALSAHMAALEAECGCLLLVRRVPIGLTPEGETFLQYALSLRRQTESLKRRMAEAAGEEAGELRIGIAPTRGRVLLPRILSLFQTEAPQVRIHLEEAANDRLVQGVRQGELDIAIAAFPDRLPGLGVAPFYTEQLALLLAESLAASLYGGEKNAVLERVGNGNLAVLEGCPFLMNSEKNIAGGMGRQRLLDAGVVPDIRVESENIETLIELARLGCGACFCPENLARMLLPPESGVHILPLPGTSYPIRFGWREEDGGWRVLERFMEAAERVKAQSALV